MTDPRTAAAPAADFLRTTGASYDAIAKEYAGEHADHLADSPLERGLLAAFAELARAAAAPVADVGSGPGHVTARLHDLGVPVFGVDLSPAMVDMARRTHPHLRFHVGSMTALDLPDATLGGVLALYSIIHVPDDHLPTALAEFHRALVPGGHVLLGFQWSSETPGLHLTERYGHEIDLAYHWRTPDQVAGLLAEADLEPRSTTVREPRGEEKLPRGSVLARKPGPSPAG
ncbi:class I SAM-dependent methyltransferase [Streptomyces sp. V3I7]|uniref:class I SAM-dependent methyltransferase n=1 Tax=Streptomyces sp. V3I7 TaxID=3042278 RepID=UPI0027D8CE4A|nr:class I SAM-dependent methyltransferase [Streptomyces sp. V3I7]